MISLKSRLVEGLLADLDSSQPKWARKNAVEKLGQLEASTPEIVKKLTAVLENDPDEEVRRLAWQTLQAPAHQSVAMTHVETQEKLVAEQTALEDELQAMSTEDLLREQVRILRLIEKQSNPGLGGSGGYQRMTHGVTVRDIEMSFGSMVEFMIKWALAAIPAGIILFLIGTFLWIIFGALLIGITSF